MTRVIRWVRTAAMVALTLTAFGCGKAKEKPAEELRPVRWQIVYSTGGSRVRTFSGSSRAGQESRLSFKVTGTVRDLPARVGETVKGGALLAALDPRDYRLQVDEAKASLQRQSAQERNASANYDRVRSLYENGHASINELDAARAGQETMSAAVRSAEKNLEIAELRLEYTRLTAPVDGAIAAVNVEENENVQAGQTVVVLTSGLLPEVEVSVPEILVSRIREGRPATVTFDAIPDRVFAATITQVAVAFTGMATTFPVTVRLNAPDPEARPGMAAEVGFTFEADDSRDIIIAPAMAVGEDRSGRFAFVVEDTADGRGVARRREIKVGELTGDGLEVLDGLVDGDLLITAGVHQLTDGTPVALPAAEARP